MNKSDDMSVVHVHVYCIVFFYTCTCTFVYEFCEGTVCFTCDLPTCTCIYPGRIILTVQSMYVLCMGIDISLCTVRVVEFSNYYYYRYFNLFALPFDNSQRRMLFAPIVS